MFIITVTNRLASVDRDVVSDPTLTNRLRHGQVYDTITRQVNVTTLSPGLREPECNNRDKLTSGIVYEHGVR